MTRRTNARVAGVAFLLYIALGVSTMVLSARAKGAGGVAAALAGMAEHASTVRVAAVVSLLASFMALVLGVSLWALTREEDPDLALLGLAFRVGEGVVGGIAIQQSLGVLWLATTKGATAPDAPTAQALAAFFLGQRWSAVISALFFAVGSTCFCWLLLRGRMLPAWMAWLGVAASVLLVATLPAQLAGFLGAPATYYVWIPMGVFELVAAGWLIVKGASPPARPPRAAERTAPALPERATVGAS